MNQNHFFTRGFGCFLVKGVPSASRNVSPNAAVSAGFRIWNDFRKTSVLHSIEVLKKLPFRIVEANDLNNGRIFAADSPYRPKASTDGAKVVGQPLLFPVSHCVVRHSRAIFAFRKPIWRSRFKTPLNLPSVIGHVNARIRWRRQDKLWGTETLNGFILLKAYRRSATDYRSNVVSLVGKTRCLGDHFVEVGPKFLSEFCHVRDFSAAV